MRRFLKINDSWFYYKTLNDIQLHLPYFDEKWLKNYLNR
jgi:hypothetical protein